MQFATNNGEPTDSYAQMLLRLVKKAGSERRAAALFGLAQASFNAWCRGRAFPDDNQAATMAQLLDLDPAYVLAVVHLERARNKESERGVIDAWKRIRAAFAKAAMLGVVTVGAASFGLPSPANAGRLDNSRIVAGLNTDCTTRRRQRRWFDLKAG